MNIEQEHDADQDSKRQQPWWYAAVGIAWLLIFFLYFYSFTLPNAPTVNGAKLSRLNVWQELPELLLNDLLPIREEGDPPAGWRFFPQRLGFIAVAIFAMAGSWGLGFLTLWLAGLRCCGISDEDDKTASHAIRLSPLEHFLLSIAVGISLWSLVTLGLGLLGFLNRILFGVLLLTPTVVAIVLALKSTVFGPSSKWSSDLRIPPLQLVCLISVAPFLLAMLLGAMLPSVDFDVKEYHIQGPKEFYQNGHISMLPHNVYTSFPFLTEMLTLSGMVLYGDWYWGAVAGKTILMCFGPLTGLAVFLIARRFFGETAGWIAMLIHLSTPWTYRISIIAYTEGGLTFYVAATLFAVLLLMQTKTDSHTFLRMSFITGLLAGSAVSCKYPGLISVTIPVGGIVLWALFAGRNEHRLSSRQMVSSLGMFIVGVFITFGPWLAKNTFETGNPVYPLLYSVFGGEDWNDAMNEKWKRAHSPDNHHLSDLAEKFIDVTTKSDWQTPLLFGLAPLSFLARKHRRLVGLFWLYFAWLFLSWWVLTHRIDRFWVPLIPVIAVLAGVGFAALEHRWRWATVPFLVAAVLFNIGFCTTRLCGYNDYLIDLNIARKVTGDITASEVVELNSLMQDRSGQVLSVGEAEVFDATYPVIYNTVFDKSIFQGWCGVGENDLPDEDWTMKPAAEIKSTFQDHEVLLVLVNWQEILRYRHTYGYTKFVAPHRFSWLVKEGVLSQPLPNQKFFRKFDSLNEREQQDVREWAPELIQTIQGEEWFVTTQYFPVAK